MNPASKINSSVSLEHISAKERQAMLITLIESLPAMDHIHEVVANYFRPLHQNERLEKVTQKFAKMVTANPTAYSGLEAQAKAQKLFDNYIAISSKEIEETTQFTESFQKLSKVISDLLLHPLQQGELSALVREEYMSRARVLHRSFPEVAIARAIGMRPNDITLH